MKPEQEKLVADVLADADVLFEVITRAHEVKVAGPWVPDPGIDAGHHWTCGQQRLKPNGEMLAYTGKLHGESRYGVLALDAPDEEAGDEADADKALLAMGYLLAGGAAAPGPREAPPV